MRFRSVPFFAGKDAALEYETAFAVVTAESFMDAARQADELQAESENDPNHPLMVVEAVARINEEEQKQTDRATDERRKWIVGFTHKDRTRKGIVSTSELLNVIAQDANDALETANRVLPAMARKELWDSWVIWDVGIADEK